MDDHINLKKTGLKATLPRLKVLSIFENSKDRHLSAEDVYKVMISSGDEVGLATIYRVLTQFEQAGLLIKHHFESGKAVFELNQKSHHDHIVCTQCGYVQEFLNNDIERIQEQVANSLDFKIIDHSLYISADCTKKACSRRIDKKNR
ncbi:MAG: ferric iron uptake transcriptional regulator [Methylophilaceae bacterium]|nr:ferric iron uptake transcriptional regulator [Methylophilaceae bacterium]